MEHYRLKAACEALLYVSDTPLTIKRIREAFDEEVDPANIREAVTSLVLDFESEGRGVRIAELAGGYQITTRPEFAPQIKKLQKIKPPKLSAQALETLAIVAYRQPIIKAEIEGIRGVSADGVLKTLLDRRLIKIAGRMDVPGKPMMYATTSEFLRYFGLKDLSSLPSLRELERELGMEENSILSELEPELPGLDGPEMEAMAAQYRAKRAEILAGSGGDAPDFGFEAPHAPAAEADKPSPEGPAADEEDREDRELEPSCDPVPDEPAEQAEDDGTDADDEGLMAGGSDSGEDAGTGEQPAPEESAPDDTTQDEPAADEENWEDRPAPDAVCDPIQEEEEG